MTAYDNGALSKAGRMAARADMSSKCRAIALRLSIENTITVRHDPSVIRPDLPPRDRRRGHGFTLEAKDAGE